MATDVLTGRSLRKSTLLSRIQEPKIANGQIVKEKPQRNERGRRSLFKRRIPIRSTKFSATTHAAKALTYKGELYTVGDVVGIESDEGTLYAQITGLLTDPYGEKSASLAWLVPTDRSNDFFDPHTWVFGESDDTPHKLAWLRLITHLPSDYFKSGIARI